MTNNIIPFDFEGQAVRVVMDSDGNPLFHANDLCAVLDYANPRQALQSHVDGDDVQKLDTIDSLGRMQPANYVTESGMYALIFGSTKEQAQRFKRWVTNQVLPTLRKTGQDGDAGTNPPIHIYQEAIGGMAVDAVSARELHAFLEVRTSFKDWIARRIEEYGFQKGQDFCSFLSESPGGRPSKEYAITLDMAKELSMVERNTKGRQARRYFIECERIAKAKLEQQPEPITPSYPLQLGSSAESLLAASRSFSAMLRTGRQIGLNRPQQLQAANTITFRATGVDILSEFGMDNASQQWQMDTDARRVSDYLQGRPRATTVEIAEAMGWVGEYSRAMEMRIARIMRDLGYRQYRHQNPDGSRFREWVMPMAA